MDSSNLFFELLGVPKNKAKYTQVYKCMLEDWWSIGSENGED